MKSLKIGLCGVGNVGSAVVRLLRSSSELLEIQGGVNFELYQIGARKGKSATEFKDVEVTKDLMEVAQNPEIDVFVELIGGTDLAYDLVTTAIDQGKHIVTANKALISTYGNEIFKAAKDKNVHIGIEASVAGGTPVIKALREGLVVNKVLWFAGILNGTSNFILTEMSLQNSNFEEALKKTQDLGLAEADPSLDINGTDAAQKATILASLAFHIPFNFSSVDFEGIESVEQEDLSYAKELGYSIKHIALGRIENDSVSVSAFPTLVSNENLLSKVGLEMNALEIYSENVGSTVYYGPGAGPEPTASAVIADLVDIANGGWNREESFNTTNLKISRGYGSSRYYRLNVKDEPGVIAKISSVFAEKKISIEALIQHQNRSPNIKSEFVPLVLVTGNISDEVSNSLIDILEKMPEIESPIKQFRINLKED